MVPPARSGLRANLGRAPRPGTKLKKSRPAPRVLTSEPEPPTSSRTPHDPELHRRRTPPRQTQAHLDATRGHQHRQLSRPARRDLVPARLRGDARPQAERRADRDPLRHHRGPHARRQEARAHRHHARGPGHRRRHAAHLALGPRRPHRHLPRPEDPHARRVLLQGARQPARPRRTALRPHARHGQLGHRRRRPHQAHQAELAPLRLPAHLPRGPRQLSREPPRRARVHRLDRRAAQRARLHLARPRRRRRPPLRHQVSRAPLAGRAPRRGSRRAAPRRSEGARPRGPGAPLRRSGPAA